MREKKAQNEKFIFIYIFTLLHGCCWQDRSIFIKQAQTICKSSFTQEIEQVL